MEWGGHFDQLVFTDEMQGVLQRHGADGRQDNGFVLAGCAHVGELLFLGGVHVDVVVAVVLADDHAFVDGIARHHEKLAARLKVEEGVGDGIPGAVGHDGAVKRLGKSPRWGS